MILVSEHYLSPVCSRYLLKPPSSSKEDINWWFRFLCGALEMIRTFDTRFRRPLLYPAELQGHSIDSMIYSSNIQNMNKKVDDSNYKKTLIYGFTHASKYMFLNGALEMTRTFDPQLRRLLLYPTELQGHPFNDFII